jgi:hypothetical protein
MSDMIIIIIMNVYIVHDIVCILSAAIITLLCNDKSVLFSHDFIFSSLGLAPFLLALQE